MPQSYTIWTDNNIGEFIKADLVVAIIDTVYFFRDGREVKSYDKEEFLRYNPSWVLLENTE